MTLFRLVVKITTKPPSYFGDLSKIKFYGRLPTEDIYENFDLQLLFINFDYFALEISEWPLFDSNTFVQFVYETRLYLPLWFISVFLDCKEIINFFTTQRRGFASGTFKTSHSWGVTNHMMHIVISATSNE